MINTLTLNPAVDHILFLKEVKKNITNRVYKSITTVGGKGTHVSINLSILGERSLAFGFAYGTNGRYIIEHLKKNGIQTQFCYADDRESRDCYLLIEDDNTCTLIAEHGVAPTQEEQETLLRKLDSTLQKGEPLVLSGYASNMPNEFFTRLMALLSAKEVRIFLDASEETLREGIRNRPYLIKPNRDELAALCGMSIETDKDVIRAIHSLNCHEIEIIAVSLGRRGSILRTRDAIYKAVPPQIDVCNTIGCGDSFLSGILFGIEKGMECREMLSFATAISCATAASPMSVGFDLEFAKSLQNQCVVTML
jgi:1-phosphofructokinase family hexose kinase